MNGLEPSFPACRIFLQSFNCAQMAQSAPVQSWLTSSAQNVNETKMARRKPTSSVHAARRRCFAVQFIPLPSSLEFANWLQIEL
jgi:hypothetical protein